MIDIDIPRFGELKLEHIVLDFNGTLAVDGSLLPGIDDMLTELAEHVTVHVLTADTFGNCKEILSGLPVTVMAISSSPEDEAKLDYVETLGADACVCIGNGMNDRLMLQSSALGIVVLGEEGLALDALGAGDIMCPDVIAALELLQQPMRVKATLRT
ncbi:MAG: ATPase P [Deltaproteobacteria bacterium]|nr:ATPase P [Deltaproteobacteria bacterium]